MAARSLGRAAFGSFGVAFTIYLLILGAFRALASEPLLVSYSGTKGDSLLSACRAVAGAALLAGLFVGATLALVGLWFDGPLRQALTALGMLIPGLLLQDAWRYAFVTTGRPRAAAFNDATWCAGEVASFLGLTLTRNLSVTNILLAWGGAGLAAALLGCFQAKSIPTVVPIVAWVRKNRGLSSRFFAEYLIAAGAGQATLLGLAAISGLTAVGAMRGAQVFFGPMAVLYGGIYLALAAEGARLRREPLRLRRPMLFASLALMGATSAWLMVGLAIPTSLGRQFFGATWPAARTVLLPFGVSLFGGSATAGAIVGLRALGAAQESLRARLFCLPVVVGAPLIGAISGPVGFAAGLAVGSWVGTLVWWSSFNSAVMASPYTASDPEAR